MNDVRREDPPPRHRVTRTFKPRRRSLSPGRQAVVERVGPGVLLDEVGPVLALDDVFGGSPVVLEIGIGKGEALVAMAAADPSTGVIGCDVHTPGIAAVLAAVERDALANVRLVHGDALELLDRIPAQSLAGIRAFFPDPWPKVRQHHRRLIRPAVVEVLVDRLIPCGFLHLATDIDDYATQMRRVCADEPRLVGGDIARPASRPVTRYEQRGIDAGRTVADLWYARVDE